MGVQIGGKMLKTGEAEGEGVQICEGSSFEKPIRVESKVHEEGIR